MFFPGSKFPSRGEVETQVKKIYPDAVVMIHYASETQPNQPLIRVAEGTLKYGNYGNYVDGQKTQPKIKEYINPRKLPVANASYEPEGEIMNEQQMNDKPNKPGSGVKNVKGKPFTQKVTNFIQQGLKNINKQVEKNPAGMMLQNMSHEPEGEVIKEEETENPTFVQFMKRIDQLPEVTREAIKNCGNDPAIAKAALEISGIDK